MYTIFSLKNAKGCEHVGYLVVDGIILEAKPPYWVLRCYFLLRCILKCKENKHGVSRLCSYGKMPADVTCSQV
jgi:hypothetical protein